MSNDRFGFKRERERERERERGPNAGISLHIAKDALLSYAGCCLINALFLLFWVDRIDWAGTIFNNTMILMGLEILLYSRVSREYAQRIAQSEKLILQYRYNALRAQVNPHFLFNSLNTLYSMISSGNRNAENFVIELTKVYRYVLTQ